MQSNSMMGRVGSYSRGPRVCACVTAAAIATLFADSAGAQTAPSDQSQQQVQEVVVTGIKADLEKSLDVKMMAPVVLDSINSTELGRFPLDNVADALGLLPATPSVPPSG